MVFLSRVAAQLASPQAALVVLLICLMAAALAGAAPDGGWCPSTASC